MNLQTSPLVQKAKEYGQTCHRQTNHFYNGQPYSVHLQMVYDYALKYIHLLDPLRHEEVLAATWTHDVIEDCRQTYTDIRQALKNSNVAELTYAVTNEKGRFRRDRGNDKLYAEMKQVEGAVFLKLCDRLANVKYSVDHGSSMVDAYRKEFDSFYQRLYLEHYKPMFGELAQLLGIPDDPDDSDEDADNDSFQPCADCDGHDACADFGCAHQLGLGHLVKTDPY